MELIISSQFIKKALLYELDNDPGLTGKWLK